MRSFICRDFDSVKILLDWSRHAHYSYLYDVKISLREEADARPSDDQRRTDQSGADPDGMRRAISEDIRRTAARAQRHALSQRPQSAIRRPRRALVRRRRHAARLPSRKWPRQL